MSAIGLRPESKLPSLVFAELDIGEEDLYELNGDREQSVAMSIESGLWITHVPHTLRSFSSRRSRGVAVREADANGLIKVKAKGWR